MRCRRDAGGSHSVAKYNHMFDGSVVVRAECDAMSSTYWVIVAGSCASSKGNVAGYESMYSLVVLVNQPSTLSVLASLYSCEVCIGAQSLQDSSSKGSSKWLESGSHVVVLRVSAS